MPSRHRSAEGVEGARARPGRGEQGSMAVEVVILTPVLFAFVVLIVVFGRYVAVQGDVEAAARDAAREASLQTSFAAADGAARSTVAASLDDRTTCQSVGIGGEWAAGGDVVVTLRCRVLLDGLGLVGVPGSVDVDAVSTVPLDPYRSYE